MAKVVAAIPGGGWYAEWQDAETLARVRSPIVCWVVNDEGEITPRVSDCHGFVCDPTEDSNFVQVIHECEHTLPAE